MYQKHHSEVDRSAQVERIRRRLPAYRYMLRRSNQYRHTLAIPCVSADEYQRDEFAAKRMRKLADAMLQDGRSIYVSRRSPGRVR